MVTLPHNYQHDADWRALFDPSCGCGMCPSIPCPNKACAYCAGGGRVSLGLPLGDPLFGQSVPCPECVGGSSGSAVAEGEFLRRSRIPVRYHHVRLASWDPKRYSGAGTPGADTRRYCETWPPAKPVLMLSGDKGTGKTHLGIGVLRDVWEKHGVVGRMWSTMDLLDRYKRTFDADRATESEHDITEELARCPLLMLDDFGAQRATEWSEALTLSVINRRYNERKPLIITTNLVNLKEERTLDRLTDVSSSVLVAFTGASSRQSPFACHRCSTEAEQYDDGGRPVCGKHAPA